MHEQTKWSSLFDGRHDAIGTDTGGCIHVDEADWETYMGYHFAVDHAVGVYPLTAQHTVKWGCADFDQGKPGAQYANEQDAQNAAQLLQRVFARLNITTWTERSRSGGHHLWLFAEQFVPARTMRHAFIAAHQIVGMSWREINPKSVELKPGQVGNYVRLPYPALTNDPTDRYRQRVHKQGRYMSADQFVREAWEQRTPLAVLERAASLAKPERKPVVIKPTPKGRIPRKLGGVGRTILNNGPREDDDRSLTLCRLAGICKGDGLTASETLSVLYEADNKWGKFIAQGRPEQIDRIVGEVFGA
jgi:hypothetical protein